MKDSVLRMTERVLILVSSSWLFVSLRGMKARVKTVRMDEGRLRKRSERALWFQPQEEYTHNTLPRHSQG